MAGKTRLPTFSVNFGANSCGTSTYPGTQVPLKYLSTYSSTARGTRLQCSAAGAACLVPIIGGATPEFCAGAGAGAGGEWARDFGKSKH